MNEYILRKLYIRRNNSTAVTVITITDVTTTAQTVICNDNKAVIVAIISIIFHQTCDILEDKMFLGWK